MKKHSNTWLLILIILNLPPTSHYKTEHIIINLATPGPNSPGDIESFIQPLFEEMAMLSEGIWMWDAIDSSYFVNHAHIVMVLGDMLGSAKLNGMAGVEVPHGLLMKPSVFLFQAFILFFFHFRLFFLFSQFSY